MKYVTQLLILASMLFIAIAATGQEKASDAVYIIFDASGSMWGQLADKSPKISVAKDVLQEFVARDFKGADLALRVYGHRREGDCTDSELLIPFAPAEQVAAALKEAISQIKPLGKTPISFSLREALADFGDRQGSIILITDGIETCDEDPCELVRAWRDKGIAIEVHVVGFGLDEKSKVALKCISDAAGTEFQDAESASGLAEGLASIHEQTSSVGFYLQGVDTGGNSMTIQGSLAQNGTEVYEVFSHKRNQVDSGTYDLTAGVLTKNGTLYRPVAKRVTISGQDDTTVTIEVATPPSVKAVFKDQEKPRDGSLIYVFQNGKETFHFRWIDEVWLDEGTYEFRANPNKENELSLTETFAAGDHKEIVFQMIHTVKITVKMVASGSEIWFRENYELWQNDELKYKVHVSNGATILPGTYDLHLPNKLTPYVKSGLVVTNENEQHFDVTVPTGQVTVVYHKADGTPDKNKRCFIGRGPTTKGVYKNAGEKYPFTPGTYNVVGWRGNYDPVVFEVKVGDDKEIILREKN